MCHLMLCLSSSLKQSTPFWLFTLGGIEDSSWRHQGLCVTMRCNDRDKNHLFMIYSCYQCPCNHTMGPCQGLSLMNSPLSTSHRQLSYLVTHKVDDTLYLASGHMGCDMEQPTKSQAISFEMLVRIKSQSTLKLSIYWWNEVRNSALSFRCRSLCNVLSHRHDSCLSWRSHFNKI